MTVTLRRETRCSVRDKVLCVRYWVAGPAGAMELRMDFCLYSESKNNSVSLDRREVLRHAHAPSDRSSDSLGRCDVLPGGRCVFDPYCAEAEAEMQAAFMRGDEPAVWRELEGLYSLEFETASDARDELRHAHALLDRLGAPRDDRDDPDGLGGALLSVSGRIEAARFEREPTNVVHRRGYESALREVHGWVTAMQQRGWTQMGTEQVRAQLRVMRGRLDDVPF